ncbi:hypoxanthine phosphoribosyltransferase [Nitrospina gracilis]|nr:hypoxanthine phosphoribosyltransferase [Nitrospina gracilis]
MDDREPLFNEQEIKVRVAQLAKEITRDYEGRNILAIGVLKGSCMFFADIVRLIELPVTMDFIIASSYTQKESSGKIKMDHKTGESVKGKDVLIIEDIVDTGLTIKYIMEILAEEKPISLKVCALLDKKEKRQVDVPIDYVGFKIPDLFVVGYGMDYENKYRNIPHITTLDKKP